MITEIVLTPAQRRAADGLQEGLSLGAVCVLHGDSGSGKTTILREIQRKTCAGWIDAGEFLKRLNTRLPAAIEESLFDVIEEKAAAHDLVIVDDLHLIVEVVENCNYQRGSVLDIAITAAMNAARSRGAKVVFGAEDSIPEPIRKRAYASKIDDFDPEDYRALCGAYLPKATVDRLDFDEIHRFAPSLDCYQLEKSCVRNRRNPDLDTEQLIEYLRSENMTSNVELDEVAAVDWNDLKGVDEIIQSLEAKVALPFENSHLAAELQLKPKRGVLLAGPPGTGKTTIGRALAHRLKSKFFLIDGTVVAGSYAFFPEVRKVFDAAKKNAPAVIFIDDADVIFEGEGDRAFCRYLLTMLDGLESASAERVCVMMTAMEASNLPAAVLRSGRVELWLETRLPDEHARAVILGAKISKLPQPLGTADTTSVAQASHGLTGADLGSVVEDGKLLFAHDRALGRELRSPEDYFLDAIATIRSNRRTYARRKSSRMPQATTMGLPTD